MKEIRTRMRGKIVFFVEMVYLLFLTFIVWMSVFSNRGSSWEIGQNLFWGLNYLQLIVLLIVSPTITASVVTLEKEQKTYDILLTTPISSWQIIWNKLLASLSYFFILIIITLPCLGLCFILGGVSPLKLFFAEIIAFGTIMIAGVFGIYISTISKRTTASVPTSSVIIIYLLIFTYLIKNSYPILAVINPLVAFNLLSSDWVVPFFGRLIPFWAPYLILTILFVSWGISSAVENIKLESRRDLRLRQLLFLLIVLSILICLINIPYNFISDINKVNQEIHNYNKVFLLFVALFAAKFSTGIITQRDIQLLNKSRWKNSLKIENWLGCNVLQGTRFSVLMVFIGSIVLGLGLLSLPIQQNKFNIIFLTFGLVLSFSLTISLIGRYISIRKRQQGKNLPKIIMSIVLVCFLFGPNIISDAILSENNQTVLHSHPTDTILFLSPFFALKVTTNPENTFNKYPYLKKLIGEKEFAVFTIGIYCLFALILALMNVFQERNLKATFITLEKTEL